MSLAVTSGSYNYLLLVTSFYERLVTSVFMLLIFHKNSHITIIVYLL